MLVKKFYVLAAGLVLLSFLAGALPAAAAKPNQINVCQSISAVELAQLYRKKLLPNQDEGGCYWSLRPKGMAYLHIGLYKLRRELRKYFSEKLPGQVKLVEINDLGDRGLMTVSEGSLGVVVIKKGEYVLKSAVTFLDIAPGSEKHKLLWKIYKRILAKLDG